MSEPLKDLGRQGVDPLDHRVLVRIARARGVTLQELVREIISAYVRKSIHDAKVVLGQDDDKPDAAESSRSHAEDHGSGRSGRK